jgi:threonine synthase
MKYISTRGKTDPIGFSDSVMTGLARDGGLLLPERIPDLSDRLSGMRQLKYEDLAAEIMAPFVDIPDADLRALTSISYKSFTHPDITPVVKVGDRYILELFHGPTLAFKDVAMQFLGNLFSYLLTKTGRDLNIVAATSGDTGSAAIHGVRGRDRIRIFVLFPHGRVSRLQERQMTTVLDENVHAYAVKGTFDDCQGILKDIFGDLNFKDRCSLGAVNSINWTRVLAQISYYFYATFRVQEQTGAEKVAFSVPTGNFGDVFAGYMAARMGLPISRLFLATNENDILARYFRTGEYTTGRVTQTISPSMDIQVASNFERYLYYRADSDAAAVSGLMAQFAKSGRLRLADCDSGKEDLIEACSATQSDTLAVMKRYWEKHHYLPDPHTAVGIHAAEQLSRDTVPVICLATAHPAKFPEAVMRAVGADVAHHPALDALAGLPTRCMVTPASPAELMQTIEKAIVRE